MLGETPLWIQDGSEYVKFVAGFLTAMGLMWRYVVKPVAQKREEARLAEIEAYVDPIKRSVLAIENALVNGGKRFDRLESKMDRLSDGLAGANGRLALLEREQTSMFSKLREHMRTEETRIEALETWHDQNKGDG